MENLDKRLLTSESVGKKPLGPSGVMRVLSALWRGWLAFGMACAAVNTFILLTLMYFLILPLASHIRLRDPLKKKLEGDSYWQSRKPVERSLRRHTLQF